MSRRVASRLSLPNRLHGSVHLEALESRLLLAVDVTGAVVAYKTVAYQQASTGAAALVSANAFHFGAQVNETAIGTVISATVTPPGKAAEALTLKAANQYDRDVWFNTQAELDAAYPNGTYQMQINAVSNGTHIVSAALTGDQYLPAAHFTSFIALQAIDPAPSFTVTWDSLTGATASDGVQFYIDDATGASATRVFKSPASGTAGALDNTSTSITVPAGTLAAGHKYLAEIFLQRHVSADTTGYPGVTATTFYGVGTGVTFTAAAPTHLAFSPQPGTATAGSVITPVITVNVLDGLGRVASTDHSSVTLNVASGPAALQGTLTVAAVQGVATFANLTLPTAGTYTLNASDGALTAAVSSAFTVNAPAALTTNLICRDPSGTGATVYQFQVKFSDTALVTESSLTAAGTLYVTGPNGFNQPATFVSANPASNAATITATYQITVNGGNTWTANQEGIYAVNLTAGKVAVGDGAPTIASTLGYFFYSYNPLFSERYYLTKYTDIFNAVMAGQFTSGYQHYKLYGEAEGRNPSPYFDEQFYRKTYPSVNAAVIAGQFKSGFDHFVQYGAAAQYQSSLFFNQQYYLRKYPGVAAAVTAGTFHSALEHFMISGQYEGYDPCIYFDTAYYLSHNTDVATAIGNGTIVSAFEHFVDYGLAEGRAAIATFSESYYLAHNADVAAAVAAGTFLSGYAHFITNGQYEVVQTGPGTYLGERNPSTLFDSGYYLTHYPDIAQAVFVDHSFASAFIHYLWAGAAEGRVGHA